MADASAAIMVPDTVLQPLIRQLQEARRVLAITGAGCSTESGIPDYRDGDGGWKRRQPVQYGDFLRHDAVRRRYWARSMAGWPVVAAADPNPAHHALADLERRGPLSRLITQNVDGLHGRAGSRRVLDLHGRLDRVICLDCGALEARAAYQCRLLAANPGWPATWTHRAPDGDADLADADYGRFRVPDCERCGGLLKPDVVFFGENVPAQVVGEAFDALDAVDLLLVAGSSLMVWSGYRFVRRAAELGIPVAIVNLGKTRGDGEADIIVRGRCGDVLSRVVEGVCS